MNGHSLFSEQHFDMLFCRAQEQKESEAEEGLGGAFGLAMLPDGSGGDPCFFGGVRQHFVSTQKCDFWVARNGGLCSNNISKSYTDVPASLLL